MKLLLAAVAVISMSAVACAPAATDEGSSTKQKVGSLDDFGEDPADDSTDDGSSSSSKKKKSTTKSTATNGTAGATTACSYPWSRFAIALSV